MLSPRIMPCLLIRENGLVKTVEFKEGTYVGDPLNAVKIYNEKQVDELIVLDIDVTSKNLSINFTLIERLAQECRMPLCYGGGIYTIEQAKKILSLGVEKVAISAAALENPQFLQDLSEQVGSQSVVVVLDLKKQRFGGGYDIYTHNATSKHKVKPIDFIRKIQELGIGEIVLNSIDNDGKMKGYDLQMFNKFAKYIHTPLTMLGGAGSLADIKELLKQKSILGVAAGSMFVFKGKYKAVLINYPSQDERLKLLGNGQDV